MYTLASSFLSPLIGDGNIPYTKTSCFKNIYMA